MRTLGPNFSDACQCGTTKPKGALFCDGCFERLPENMQAEINLRMRDFKTTAANAASHLIRKALFA